MVIKRKKINKKKRGFSLVELIVAVGIFAVLASGAIYVTINSYRVYYGTSDKQAVVEFAQEGIEAVKSIRDNSWADIEAASDGSNRGLDKVSGLWSFSGTYNTRGALTRVVVISDVERDSTGTIGSGTDDPNTKKVTVTVSGSGIANYVLSSYLTNWSIHSWTQTDWSGTSSNEFWASPTTASSSYSNISTTTVGLLELAARSGTGMSWGALADLGEEARANYIAWRDPYDIQLSADGNSMYVTGTTNYQMVKYDITRAHTGILSIQMKKNLPWHVSSMVVHPNGNYAYFGRRAHSNGAGAVCVANLNNTDSIVSGDCINVTSAYTTVYIMDMVVSSAGDWLYIFDSQGFAYAIAISGGGATLTVTNDAQLISSSAGNSINNVYLDESGASPYIYMVTDDNSGEFRKMGIDNGYYFSSTSTSAYVVSSYSGDMTDIKYLETSSSKNRFVITTENSSAEMLIVEDQGGSLTQLSAYNLSTSQTNAVLALDVASNLVFIQYYSPAGLYTVDITNRSSPVDAGFTASFVRRPSSIPYSGFVYSTTSRGLFFADHKADATVDLYYIGKPFTKVSGGGTFNYKRKITLGLSDKVSGGPHTNFPVVISESQDYLKSVANGGKVESANGYDIIFTSDEDGNTLLDHEIEYYDPATGELTAWVKIPSLDTNTDIYMFYGNDNITASQENPPGVWSNGYQIVNHLVDDSTAGTRNSVYSSNAGYKKGVNAPLQSTGKIGRGQTFDGDKTTTPYDYITIDNSIHKVQGTGDFTVEFWINPDSTYTIAAAPPVYFGCGDLNNDDGWMIVYYPGSTKKLRFAMGNDNIDNLGSVYSSNALTEDAWQHISVVVDRDAGYYLYKNGATENSCTIAPCNDTSAYSIGEVYNGYFGRWYSDTDYFFKGGLDEFRVSTTTRSVGWLLTGYNNMNATSTFYSIDTENTASGYESPGYIYSSIYDIGSTDGTLQSISVHQNVPSGCSLTIRLEGADNSAFSGATYQDFSDSSRALFTSSTPATLNTLRYLRYKVTLAACNSNAQTPALYSLRLNYR